MASLSLTLDGGPKQIAEPGFHEYFAGRRIWESGIPDSNQDNQRIFVDPTTGTLMLYPLNLSPTWLNSADQVASIIDISQLIVSATDLANRTVFEEVAFGNADNRYIYFRSVPFTGAPLSPGPPGAPTSLVGAPYGSSISGGLATIADQTEFQYYDFSAPNTPAGTIDDGRVIAYSRDRFPANAPFYFRWFHPSPLSGHQTRYIFYVGQLAIAIDLNLVTLYLDVSSGGDRSSYSKLWSKSMFGPGDFSPANSFGAFGSGTGAESPEGDRSLFILPYFRNRVLLYSQPTGRAYSVVVKSTPALAPESIRNGAAADAYIYEITRADTIAVYCVTPAPGRFQVQRVKFAISNAQQAQLKLPPIQVDYSPVTPPIASISADHDHGTASSASVTFPTGYSYPVNARSRCPAPATNATASQGREYGVRVSLSGEATQRWTPFFYGLQLASPTTFVNSVTSPTTVLDTGAGTSNVKQGHVAWGQEPGDGRMEIEVQDESPYALQSFYSRPGLRAQLFSDATAIFTGLLEPFEVMPLKETARPVIAHLAGQDRWKQLAETRPLRDQRDWSNTGHITVVLSIAQQGGIDTAGAETPPLNATYNTPLGGAQPTVDQDARVLNPGWQPQFDDSAASFILKIARLFSGWDVGFRQDGTFYYLPKDWFATTTLRFFNSAAERAAAAIIDPTVANNPLIRGPVDERTVEPEANLVLIRGGADKDGTVMTSSLWVDWAALLNPAAVNFMNGRIKPGVYQVRGVYNCEELNRFAAIVFDQARRRRRTISFSSDLVPTLKAGQIIEVGTLGLARLTGVKSDLVRNNWHDTSYYCERLESGFGLP